MSKKRLLLSGRSWKRYIISLIFLIVYSDSSRYLFASCTELWENWKTWSKICFLLGEGAVDPNDPNRESTLSQLAKTEISLSLTSKYELREGEDQDLKSLMIK